MLFLHACPVGDGVFTVAVGDKMCRFQAALPVLGSAPPGRLPRVLTVRFVLGRPASETFTVFDMPAQ